MSSPYLVGRTNPEPGSGGSRRTRSRVRASARPSRERTSSTTSCTRLAPGTSSGRIVRRQRTSHGEAAQAGVQQIVYLGGLGGDSSDASPHLRSRQETGERLGANGVPVTTLRAAMVIGKGSAAFETILGLVKRLPVMITPSWVSTPTQPIALGDIARYLAGVCGNDATIGEGFDAGGAEIMTVQADDRANRTATRPATTHHRGPRPHTSAISSMARTRHTRQCLRCPPARGRTPQPDRGTRGTIAEAAPIQAHIIRQSSTPSAREITAESLGSPHSRCNIGRASRVRRRALTAAFLRV